MARYPTFPISSLIVSGIVALLTASCGPPEADWEPRDPGDIRIDTSDVELFIQLQGETTLQAPSCPGLDRYLNDGSSTLRAFHRAAHPGDSSGSEELCRAIHENPEVYGSLEDQLAHLRGSEPRIKELLVRWRALHPVARLPHIHFVVGPMVTPFVLQGGTLVVSAEFLGSSPPGRSAGQEQPGGMGGQHVDLFSPALARELARIGQHEPFFFPIRVPGLTTRENVLTRAIRLGALDFLAELVAGERLDPELHAWARPREAEIWQSFRDRMHSRDFSGWLEPGGDDEPTNLGRFVGYRIVESFWNRQSDGHAAVREILNLEDFDGFLEASLYAGSGPSQTASVTHLDLASWPGFSCGGVRAGPTRMYHCTGGEGSLPILLDAGEGRSHRSWQGVASDLAAVTRVVAFDRPTPREIDPDDPDSEVGSSSRGSLALLMEVVAGPGPYLLVGTESSAEELETFAELHPWRTAGIVSLADAVFDLTPAERRRAVSRVSDALSNVQAQPDGLTDPVNRGEPTGCWLVELTGTRAPPDLPQVIRLLPVTAAGDADGMAFAGHPVLAPRKGNRSVGQWMPRSLRTLRLEVKGASDTQVRANLERGGQGLWIGPITYPTQSAGHRMILSAHPCERSD